MEDCQVWVQSEKIHLTLKRLEAPGSLEDRWDRGWGQSHGGKGWGGDVGYGAIRR